MSKDKLAAPAAPAEPAPDLLATRLAVAEEMAAQYAAQLDQLREQKDGAYLERNRCVALIARMALALGQRAGVARTAIEGWSEDWHGCVYIDLPAGQASWHYHDSQASLFDGLPAYGGAWDGHSTPEKYERVAASYAAPAAPAPAELACDIQPRPLAYSLADYHRAMSEGPLHYTWQDKPHRLVYDLIAAVRYYAAPAAPAEAPAEPAAFPWNALLRDVAKAKQQLADFGFRASYLDWIEMQAAPAAPADTKDAERYRWLRDQRVGDWAICIYEDGDWAWDTRAAAVVDAAIDAAIAASKGGAA